MAQLAGSAPVLALTADESLADELQRLAAAAGVELVVQAEPAPSSRAAGPPALLLVGSDLAQSVAAVSRWRSPATVLVARISDDEVWRQALALAAEQVAVLPAAREWLVERLARTIEPAATARVFGLLGGCGGAGASVLAAAIAVCAAERQQRTLLADLDPLGGGLDLLLGLQDVAGLRWPDLTAARGRLPAGSVHDALPRCGDLAVLAWGRGAPLDLPTRAVEAVLDAATRSHDLVVLDLPRPLDAVAACGLQRAGELVVVVPARVRAVAAAAQVLAAVGGEPGSARVVVRRGAGDDIRAGQVADVLGLPLAAELRDDVRLGRLLARGDVPGLRARSPLRGVAELCLATPSAQRAA